MARFSVGRGLVAALATGAGGALVFAGAARPDMLPSATGSFSIPHAAIGGGAVLALLGFWIFTTAFRPAEGPVPAVPAHVAFTSRSAQAIEIPSTDAAAKAPPPVSRESDLDAQIRELTRKINRAGVMLATGKLSEKGYTKYVDDLKRQRGILEADRVHREWRQER